MADLIQELPAPAMVNLRGDAADPAFVAAVADVAGLRVPVEANRYVSAGERDLLWLGPDEWLLIDRDCDGASLERDLAAALARHFASVVDVSGNRALIRISGGNANALLARGCALDLEKLEAGHGCAQTLVARAQVILIRRMATSFDLLPRRSFAGYLHDWLRAAAQRL